MSAEPGTLQRRLGEALFARVAGPDGPANRARFATPGPRWFSPDRPIRRVHGDAAMFVGGLRALLLQSLHPQAMIAVAQHSDYRADPWGRLQRTSTFLAATTFGAADDAQRAVDHVRRVHQFITGADSAGRPYRADDPHLLSWVHAAETDSFLRCHQRYVRSRSTPPAATATSPTPPGSRSPSGCQNRRRPGPSWPRRWPPTGRS